MNMNIDNAFREEINRHPTAAKSHFEIVDPGSWRVDVSGRLTGLGRDWCGPYVYKLDNVDYEAFCLKKHLKLSQVEFLKDLGREFPASSHGKIFAMLIVFVMGVLAGIVCLRNIPEKIKAQSVDIQIGDKSISEKEAMSDESPVTGIEKVAGVRKMLDCDQKIESNLLAKVEEEAKDLRRRFETNSLENSENEAKKWDEMKESRRKVADERRRNERRALISRYCTLKSHPNSAEGCWHNSRSSAGEIQRLWAGFSDEERVEVNALLKKQNMADERIRAFLQEYVGVKFGDRIPSGAKKTLNDSYVLGCRVKEFHVPIKKALGVFDRAILLGVGDIICGIKLAAKFPSEYVDDVTSNRVAEAIHDFSANVGLERELLDRQMWGNERFWHGYGNPSLSTSQSGYKIELTKPVRSSNEKIYNLTFTDEEVVSLERAKIESKENETRQAMERQMRIVRYCKQKRELEDQLSRAEGLPCVTNELWSDNIRFKQNELKQTFDRFSSEDKDAALKYEDRRNRIESNIDKFLKNHVGLQLGDVCPLGRAIHNNCHRVAMKEAFGCFDTVWISHEDSAVHKIEICVNSERASDKSSTNDVWKSSVTKLTAELGLPNGYFDETKNTYRSRRSRSMSYFGTSDVSDDDLGIKYQISMEMHRAGVYNSQKESCRISFEDVVLHETERKKMNRKQNVAKYCRLKNGLSGGSYGRNDDWTSKELSRIRSEFDEEDLKAVANYEKSLDETDEKVRKFLLEHVGFKFGDLSPFGHAQVAHEYPVVVKKNFGYFDSAKLFYEGRKLWRIDFMAYVSGKYSERSVKDHFAKTLADIAQVLGLSKYYFESGNVDSLAKFQSRYNISKSFQKPYRYDEENESGYYYTISFSDERLREKESSKMRKLQDELRKKREERKMKEQNERLPKDEKVGVELPDYDDKRSNLL